MENVTFEDNDAWGVGGGLYVRGNFAGGLKNVKFLDNAAWDGGGGFALDGDFSGDMQSVDFYGNKVEEDGDIIRGGGGFTMRGNFTGNINDSKFSSNVAVGHGGGFSLDGNFSGNLNGSLFTHNYVIEAPADNLGGGAFLVNGDFSGNLTDTLFELNRAVASGGAIAVKTLSGTVDGVDFINNYLDGVGSNNAKGGAIYAENGLSLVKNSRFLGNYATSNGKTHGGAVYLGNKNIATSTFENTSFLNNQSSAGSGGAIYYEFARAGDATLNISAAGDNGRTLFYGNKAGWRKNALHIGLSNRYIGNTVTLNINTDTDTSQVLMFDPISQDKANEAGNTSWKTEVNKTGLGEWVLGGNIDMQGNSH